MSIIFQRLTRPAIRALATGQRITERGITAEKLADGDVRYSINVMASGRRVHRVIGTESAGTTRTQAEEYRSQVLADARHNRLDLPFGRKNHLAFGEGADLYVKNTEETGGKNIKAKRAHLALHLKPFFGARRLDQISEFDIDRYKKHRRDAGAEPGTVNRELATLSHLLSRAVAWKWIPRKPARISKLTESSGRIVALNDAQCDALLSAAVADADSYLWLFVMFGLNTAMRHAEILAARFEHVDLDRLRLHIPKAKSGMREQPITPELADVLLKERETAADGQEWIFPSPRPGTSGTGHRERMDKPFRRAVIATGLDPATVTPHVMRHTAITRLVMAGVDIPTIQRISGHKTTAMVLRYAHVHGQHIDRAMSALGRTIPKPDANESAGTVSQKLHVMPKRSA